MMLGDMFSDRHSVPTTNGYRQEFERTDEPFPVTVSNRILPRKLLISYWDSRCETPLADEPGHDVEGGAIGQQSCRLVLYANPERSVRLFNPWRCGQEKSGR